MDALRMAASLLSLGRAENPLEDALTAIASFPTIVGSLLAAAERRAPVAVRPTSSHAAHYLHQLSGTEPSAERARALKPISITVCDHGLNASTFTARVIVSTRSDVISAITGAVGALKGPLHGGAPGPALDMVFEIGTPERAEAVIRARLERGERLMGFGHRVYRVRDPRADVLARRRRTLLCRRRRSSALRLARAVEATALRLLRERKPERRLDTNVEFYTALLLHGLGLAARSVHARHSPWAECSAGRRTAWSSCATARLIRPQSVYIGPTGLDYQNRLPNAVAAPRRPV